LDLALTVVQSPKASIGEKALAGGYILAETAAHVALAAGTAGLACAAAGPGCVTAVEGALGMGAAACKDGDCTNEVNTAAQVTQQGSQTISHALNAARNVTFDPVQVQAKFKHAVDFGIQGNYNQLNATRFTDALQNHIGAANTQAIQGTYRGAMRVIHYFDPATGRNVIVDLRGNFISAWQLSAKQIEYLLANGNIQ
jgi:hypothetical protein